MLSHSSDVIGACICSNDVNVCGSAHCGCVVNGSVAMAAFLVLLLSIFGQAGAILLAVVDVSHALYAVLKAVQKHNTKLTHIVGRCLTRRYPYRVLFSRGCRAMIVG